MDNGRIDLTVFGTLVNWSRYNLTEGFSYPLEPDDTTPLIVGSGSPDLTILNAWCWAPNVQRGPRNTEGWSGDAVVEASIDAPPEQEPTFGAIRFELQGLSTFARSKPRMVRVRRQRGIQLNLESGAAVVTRGVTEDGAEVTITQHAGWRADDLGNTVIETPATVEVRPIARTSWRELLYGWMQPMQALIWLSTGEPAFVDSLDLLVADPQHGRERWAQLHASLVQDRRPRNRSTHDYPTVIFHAHVKRPGFRRGSVV